jgi:predicted NACHT family NTPase
VEKKSWHSYSGPTQLGQTNTGKSTAWRKRSETAPQQWNSLERLNVTSRVWKTLRSEFQQSASDEHASPDDLRGQTLAALYEWRDRHPDFGPRSSETVDTRRYLSSLRDSSGWIDIRGLRVGSGKAHRFPIEELYIPLSTMQQVREATESRDVFVREPIALEDALTYQSLVIVGDPGAGKTTFIRRIAYLVSDALLRSALEDKPLVAGPSWKTSFPCWCELPIWRNIFAPA